MKAARILLVIVILILVFVLGRRNGIRSVKVTDTTTTDTVMVYVDRYPTPSDVSDPVEEVEATLPVGRDLGPTAPAAVSDTIPCTDSATVRVPLKFHYFNKPGVYSITALGYQVTLPKIEVFGLHTTTTQTQIIREVPAWEVGLELGINRYNKWVGATARYNFGRIALEGMGGYDPYRKELIVEGRLKVAFFRTYRTKK